MFNKIFLAIICAISLSHSVDDFSSERLLGIEVGYTGLETQDGIGLDESTQGAEFGFRIGAQNDDWRTVLIGSMSSADGHKIQKAMISFDKFVWQSLYKKDNIMFKPYLSGHIGYLKHTSADISETGMLYGGGAGLVWNVLNEVDFDLGYRYSFTALEKLDSLSTVTLSVNYIY